MTMNCFPDKLYVYECRGTASPVREPAGEGYLGIWPEMPFYYVFFDRPAQASMFKWLEENGNTWSLTHTYQLDYEQWQQISRSIHRIGPFVIRGPAGSESPVAGEGQTPILLDPGVVFGTGVHETTRGCLLAIAELFEHHAISSVVDLGTGTGILALACAGLGATRVLAVDCNPLAVRVARSNVLANGRQAMIDVMVAQDLGVFKRGSDLLLMNLEWPCLRQTLAQKIWLEYRWVVMSGFLSSQWPEIVHWVTDHARVLLQRNLNDWMTIAVESKLLET